MSTMEPPPFQEAARCDVCKCSFNTFRRRHHCRCCGRTLCHEHSANQMTLPQFGIHSLVRVCADCSNNNSRSNRNVQASVEGVESATDSFSRLDISVDSASEIESPSMVDHSVPSVPECKCGMPLCICEAPKPSTDALPVQRTHHPSSTQLNKNPKKIDPTPRRRVSTSGNKDSVAMSLGQATNGPSNQPKMDYEATGEGLREAIKNDDLAAVRKLLGEDVNANYHDKQGMSLLHLAAVFNRTDIAFVLMESGASVDYRNAQGETPLDCAPVTLQHKMRKKIEDGN